MFYLPISDRSIWIGGTHERRHLAIFKMRLPRECDCHALAHAICVCRLNECIKNGCVFIIGFKGSAVETAEKPNPLASPSDSSDSPMFQLCLYFFQAFIMGGGGAENIGD